MALSADAVRSLAIALTSQDLGNQVATAVNAAGASEALVSASVAAHGSGASNTAFTFIAGSAGACTVTVGPHTGISITGSGTAATDATALAAAIAAAAPELTVTHNAGTVRIVANATGPAAGNLGNAYVTTVTASGGSKLSASSAHLVGGFSAGGYSLVKFVANSLASATLAGLLPGDLVLDLTTVADNTSLKVVVTTANTINFTPTLHDVLVVLRPLPAPTSFKF
jgi:hypothetical protein